jgi:hypothetical protein
MARRRIRFAAACYAALDGFTKRACVSTTDQRPEIDSIKRAFFGGVATASAALALPVIGRARLLIPYMEKLI